MEGFIWSRSTGIDLKCLRERYLSRKVHVGERFCGRFAKDQIGDSTYSFFLRFRAKGSRKARQTCAKDVSTRAMPCPKWAASWFWSKGKEATYHNDILVASIHDSCKQQPIYCIVCIRVCLIPYIWFLIRILDFGKCNPYGAAKGGERFAKGGFLGTFI